MTGGEDKMVHGLDIVDFHPLHAFQASHVDQDDDASLAATWESSSTDRRGHVLQQMHVHRNHRAC